MASDEQIRKARAMDIVSVVMEAGIDLKKCGDHHVGFSPFRVEKNPSFHVYPKTNTFKDYGGQQYQGDVIQFVRLHYNLDFPGAVRRLVGGNGNPKKPGTPPSTKPKSHKEERDFSSSHFYCGFQLNNHKSLNHYLIEKRGLPKDFVRELRDNKAFAYHSYDWGGESHECVMFAFRKLDDIDRVICAQIITCTGLPITEEGSDRRFLKGSNAKGGFFQYGDHSKADLICITEGVLTALSISAAFRELRPDKKVVPLATGSASSVKQIAQLKPYLENGKMVVIFGDADDAGFTFANKAAKTLPGVMGIEWDEQYKDGCDANDLWKNGQANVIIEMIDDAKVVKPPEKKRNRKKTSSPLLDLFFPDDKFAPAEVVSYLLEGLKLNLFHDGASFFIYDERGLWVPVHDNVVGKIVKELLKDKAKTTYIKDVLKLLEIETYITPVKLKTNYSLINLKNGVLNLETNSLMPHDPKYLLRVQLPIEFDPNATCPIFTAVFLAKLFPEDLQKAKTLQDFAGYCLLPQIFIHKCLFLIGFGANGKSTFIKILIKIIGEDNVSGLELHQLGDKFLLGTLRNKLLNVSSEVETKEKLNTEAFKKAVSGDLLQADQKFKPPFTFFPVAKHVFSMNEIPVITDRTFALARRLIIVRFNQVFDGPNDDKKLDEKLTEELPGIFNWALCGLARVLQNQEITESETMLADKREFMRSIDPVISFTEDQCLLSANETIKKDTLYKAYVQYCHDGNMRPLSKNKFYPQLLHSYPAIREVRPDGGARYFEGITTGGAEN